MKRSYFFCANILQDPEINESGIADLKSFFAHPDKAFKDVHDHLTKKYPGLGVDIIEFNRVG